MAINPSAELQDELARKRSRQIDVEVQRMIDNSPVERQHLEAERRLFDRQTHWHGIVAMVSALASVIALVLVLVAVWRLYYDVTGWLETHEPATVVQGRAGEQNDAAKP